MSSSPLNKGVTPVSYEAEYAAQTHSWNTQISEDIRRKNLLLRDRLGDILPIVDRYKLNDCDLLYRFLIARNGDVATSETSIRAYVSERQKMNMDSIQLRAFPSEYELTASSLYGFTKEGHPIVWNKPDPQLLIKILKNGEHTETMLQIQMRTIEAGRFVAQEHGVPRCALVLDLAKVSVSSVNSATLGFLREFFRRQQEFYPEVFSYMLVFNAGWTVESAWKVLRPFVDSRVQRKIHFFRGSPNPDALSSFVGAENILPSYGGTGTRDEVAELLELERRRLASRLGTDAEVMRSESERQDLSENSETGLDDGGHSVYTIGDSFVSDGGGGVLQIGAPGVLSRSASVGPLQFLPSSDIATDASRLITLTEFTDGRVMGFCEDVHIGTLHNGLIYAGDGAPTYCNHQTEQNAADEGSVGAPNDPAMAVAELRQEAGHAIHHCLIVRAAAQRQPLFLLRKSRVRRRVRVFHIFDGATVESDAVRGDTIIGRRAVLADCVPAEGGAKDPAAWVMRSLALKGGRKPLAEHRGQVLNAYGVLTQMPMERLFALLMGVCAAWESDLSEEGKLMRPTYVFGLRVMVPNKNFFSRGLRSRRHGSDERQSSSPVKGGEANVL